MKVVMKCVFCDFSAKWYENQWQEVFEYKSKNKDYVCTECFNEKAIKQIKKELFFEKKSGFVFSYHDMKQAFLKGKNNWGDKNFFVELKALHRVRKQQQQKRKSDL